MGVSINGYSIKKSKIKKNKDNEDEFMKIYADPYFHRSLQKEEIFSYYEDEETRISDGIRLPYNAYGRVRSATIY
jgi:hypothetical protein